MPALRSRLAIGVMSVWICVPTLAADDWPQWRGRDRMGLWHESGIVERFPDEGLATVWRTPVGPGFAGPAVADGRVFVLDYEETPGTRTMDGTERLLCLDEETGEVPSFEWCTTNRRSLIRCFRATRSWPQTTSVVSSTDLYTESGDAPGRQGAKSEHIGHM